MGLLTIALTLLGWSSVPLFLRDFTKDIDAWTANGWRYGFSALIWLPLLLVGMRRGTLSPGLFRAAIVPSIFNILGQACFAWAPYFIKPGLMTFGLRTQILFVAVGAYVLFPSERRVLRSGVFIFALVSVFAGAMGTLLLTASAAAPHTAADPVTPTLFGLVLTDAQATLFGGGLSVLSGSLFAGYALSIKKYMHGVHPVTAFAAICQYTGVGMLILMFALAKNFGGDVRHLPSDRLLLLALSAIIGIALGHVFYYISIARLGIALSSGIIQLQPLIVAVASTYLLRSRFQEHLGASQWMCGFAAVGGAILMLLVQKRVNEAERGGRSNRFRASRCVPVPSHRCRRCRHKSGERFGRTWS